MRILMVCLGNICRSPLAEGIMQQKITQRKLNWNVDSAGTGYWHVGDRPDPRSIATAKKFGIDITNQRARQIQPIDFEHFDLIFVMDTQNQRDVLRLAATDEYREKVRLILNESYPTENRSVPDPYYDDDGFEAVFQMLDDACDAFLDKVMAGI